MHHSANQASIFLQSEYLANTNRRSSTIKWRLKKSQQSCNVMEKCHIIEYLQRSYRFAFFEPLFGRKRSHWTRYLYRYYARCWKARHLCRFGTSCCQKSLSLRCTIWRNTWHERKYLIVVFDCAGSCNSRRLLATMHHMTTVNYGGKIEVTPN